MTRTLLGVVHYIAIVTTYVFGIAALASVFVVYSLDEHPKLSFTGLGMTLVLLGLSIGCHVLEIILEQKSGRQLAPLNPPLYK